MALALRRGRDYTSPVMIRDRRSRVLLSALWLPAICFLVVAQLALGFASLREGRFGADARSHVEQAGTNTHHAHNAADCVACAARGLLAVANHTAQPSIESNKSVSLRLAERDEHLAILRESKSRPRAPPVRLA
jgi:hypothetical protein